MQSIADYFEHHKRGPSDIGNDDRALRERFTNNNGFTILERRPA